MRLLGILFLACTLNFTDRAILSAVVEPMRHELGLSDVQIGLLQGLAFAVTYSLMGLPVGRLAERYNRLRIVATTVVFFSVATGLCGLATGFFQMFLLRVAVGVGEGGFMAPATSLVADHYPRNRRASAIAVLLLGTPVGFLIGSLVGGRIAEAFGWRMAFFAMSVPGIIVALLLLLSLREPPRGLAEGVPPTPAAAPPPSFWAVVRHMFGLPAFRHLMAGAVLCTLGANAIGQFQFTYFVRVQGLSLSDAGATSGMISFLSLAPGMLIGGNVVDRVEKFDVRWNLWIPVIGSLVGAAAFAAGFAQPTVAYAVPLLVVGGVFLFFYFAPSYAMVQNMAGVRMRASAVAIYGVFSGLVGAGLGPTFLGLVSDRIARRDFTLGDFSRLCVGGRGLDAGSAVDTACRTAAAVGLREALMLATLFMAWGALHFYLASRHIGAGFEAGRRAST
jgi:MFS family permease